MKQIHPQHQQQKNNYDSKTIKTLTTIMDAIDPYMTKHGKNVAHYATSLAKELGLTKDQITDIWYGAFFHDIGKICVPSHIICKKGPLTNHEYKFVKGHSQKGALILKKIGGFKKIIPIVLYHHEMFGGNGYPEGRCGNKIPLAARIISIADVYDALTSTRSYHKARNSQYAINYIIKNTPQQFDPELVDIFARIVKKL